jgi:hypothetical protein
LSIEEMKARKHPAAIPGAITTRCPAISKLSEGLMPTTEKNISAANP